MELNNELPTRQVSVSPGRLVGTGVRVTNVHPVSYEDTTPQPTVRTTASALREDEV